MKNLLCLSGSFANSNDLSREPYQTGNREVHSTSGRNMNEWRAQEAASCLGNFILHGHFGELAPFREVINNISDKKFVVITFDTIEDRKLLGIRQQRLGQHSHEYYLHEEQFFLYQPAMYNTYFGDTESKIFSYPLTEFWHPVINHSNTWNSLMNFLGITVDLLQAQQLHDQWRANNSMSDYY